MDRAMLLFAWATEIQTLVTEAEGWSTVHLAKIEELQGTDPKIVDVTGAREVVVRGRVPARSVVIPGTRRREFPFL